MHRTTGEDYILEGGNRMHTEGTPPSVLPTGISSEFLNALQEEFSNLLELNGVTLNVDADADRTAGWRQVYDLLFTLKKLGENSLADDAVIGRSLSTAVFDTEANNILEKYDVGAGVLKYRFREGILSSVYGIPKTKLRSECFVQSKTKFFTVAVDSTTAVDTILASFVNINGGAAGTLIARVHVRVKLRFATPSPGQSEARLQIKDGGGNLLDYITISEVNRTASLSYSDLSFSRDIKASVATNEDSLYLSVGYAAGLSTDVTIQGGGTDEYNSFMQVSELALMNAIDPTW